MTHTVEYVTLTLGDEPWTFRALDLDQIEDLEPQFSAVSGIVLGSVVQPKEAIQAVAEIAAASLKRRHPDMTPERARKLITLGTIGAVIDAVRGVSELATSGEAVAGK